MEGPRANSRTRFVPRRFEGQELSLLAPRYLHDLFNQSRRLSALTRSSSTRPVAREIFFSPARRGFQHLEVLKTLSNNGAASWQVVTFTRPLFKPRHFD